MMPRLPFPGRRPARPPAAADVPQEERPTELERIVGWVDDRTGVAGMTRGAMGKVFPDHWSFLLGEVALFCFVILVATGVFLTFFYVPSAELVPYEGSYPPLRGVEVSQAFASVMDLSFEVRAGLLMRQIHHWTALVFVAVIALHMSRVFFTGAFRKPRDINWVIGVSLLFFALAEGFSGYSLPDDVLSGTGLRITYSAILAIPIIGPNIAFLIFGGEFPTEALISRLFVFHVMLLPGLFIGAIATHVGLTWLQKHTMFKGRGATERTIIGPPFWPVQVFRSVGLFFLTAAALALVAGLVQINPVWVYGPFVPYVATVPAQPDWYVGWLEGALRLGIPFEPTILGITFPTPFIPGILIPGIIFGAITLWPWIERFVTRDRGEHHLLDWPWEAPRRTAIGVAVLTYFIVQTVAGGNDVLAVFLDIELGALNTALQFGQVLLPIAAGVVTWKLCRDRQRRGHEEPAGGTAVVRTAAGGFEEVHR